MPTTTTTIVTKSAQTMIQRTFRLRSKFSVAFNYRNKLDEQNNGIE